MFPYLDPTGKDDVARVIYFGTGVDIYVALLDQKFPVHSPQCREVERYLRMSIRRMRRLVVAGGGALTFKWKGKTVNAFDALFDKLDARDLAFRADVRDALSAGLACAYAAVTDSKWYRSTAGAFVDLFPMFLPKFLSTPATDLREVIAAVRQSYDQCRFETLVPKGLHGAPHFVLKRPLLANQIKFASPMHTTGDLDGELANDMATFGERWQYIGFTIYDGGTGADLEALKVKYDKDPGVGVALVRGREER